MARPNIVLVHGAWADGSCWSGVIERLQAEGYHVAAPAVPAQLARRRCRPAPAGARVPGRPDVVAGHSYGGQIMTALGNDAPNVVALVYIAAFGLDEDESLGALLSQGPVTPALAHCSLTRRASAGCLRTTSSTTSPPTSTRPGPGCYTPCSNP